MQCTLDDEVRMPFDVLRAKFSRFAETNGIDLKRVRISETSIRGSFTDQSGVEFQLDFSARDEGRKSSLRGSISKEIDGTGDVHTVGRHAEDFTHALLHG